MTASETDGTGRVSIIESVPEYNDRVTQITHPEVLKCLLDLLVNSDDLDLTLDVLQTIHISISTDKPVIAEDHGVVTIYVLTLTLLLYISYCLLFSRTLSSLLPSLLSYPLSSLLPYLVSHSSPSPRAGTSTLC